MAKKAVLIITDGIGYCSKTEHNAFYNAKKPTYDKLFNSTPHSFIDTFGLSVGLPEGQMGNSEVGHMSIGSGRVLYQDLVKISLALSENKMQDNEELKNILNASNKDYSIGKIPKETPQTGPGYYSGFQIDGVNVDDFSQKYNFNPKFDYCYTTKTTYTKQVCVPSNKNSCDVSIDKFESQDGPLKVVVDRITGFDNNIRIDFKITNSNGGQVVNECFKTDDYTNAYSKPSVKLGSTTGNCQAVSGENIVNGKSNFYCEFSRQGTDSYSSQVVVEFDYKYQQTIKKEIIVKDLNNGYN